ncbi:MAG: DUF1835 domain-containing protein [Bacteroidota bacterium]|nr:DUF1835 domain-containing protein [Bacteroidota bacterium]
MIHIVFQEADVAALTKSFELDGTLLGPILLIRDDYAAGPIKDLTEEEGKTNRRLWWKTVLENGPYEGLVESGLVDDDRTLEELAGLLDEDPSRDVWIWAAQNAHDVSGYYWLISRLQSYAGKVFILYLNNLPFLNEKGHLFYPTQLSEIQPREFLKARKLARPVTPSEFEIDPDEWTRLCNEDKEIRILEGGKKLSQHGVAYFDKMLLEFINPGWQKAQKVVHSVLAKKKPATGDAYLLWRLRNLVESGVLDGQGDSRNPREYEIKLRPAGVDSDKGADAV